MEFLDRILLETVDCPLRCKRGDDYLFSSRDRLQGLPGEFHIVRCRKCGLIRTNPRPTKDTIMFYYPEGYLRLISNDPANDQESSSHSNFVKRYVNKTLQFETESVPPMKAGKFLEVGCGTGRFLKKMANNGWNVTGIEPSKEAADNLISMGFEIHWGTLDTAPDPHVPYDMAACWMVLEHLHDPLRSLEKIHRWVRPGGWLALSMPNAGSLEFRIFRDAWFGLQVPTHLFHFTPRTIRYVLAKTGWHVERVAHQRVLGNLVASIGYRLADYGFGGKLSKSFVNFPARGGRANVILYPLALVLGLLGQTGRMTVWAKRIER